MFTVDAAINDRILREKDLFKVLFSMNQHQVATPDLSVEDARSYVFFVREGGRACVYVGLHFMRTGARQYYTHSSNPFPESEMPDIENAARSFAEDLGAMLDELDFSTLSRDEKNRWFDEQDSITGGKKNDSQEPSDSAAAAPAAQSVSAQASVETEKPSTAVPPGGQQMLRQQVPLSESEPQSILTAIPQSAPAVQPAAPIEITVLVPAPTPAQPVPVQTPVQSAAPVQPEPPLQTAVPPAVPASVFSGFPAAALSPSTPASPQSRPAPAASVPLSQPASTQQVRDASYQPAPAQRPAPVSKQPAPPDAASASEQPRPEDVLEEAVKAGVVKAPKAQLKKEIRTAAGVIRREKEALARLLASF
jgi:hypothetical protein